MYRQVKYLKENIQDQLIIERALKVVLQRKRARAEYKIAKTYTIYSSHGAVYFTYYCDRNWLFSAEILGW